MSEFLIASEFKWIDPKDFDLNKYGSNCLKGCVSETHLEYPKVLCKLHNDYPLAANKIDMKEEMLSSY